MTFYLACRWHKCHFCELSFVQAPKCLLHMYIFQSKLFTKRAFQFYNLACTCQFWKPCVCKVNKFLSQFVSFFLALLVLGSKKMSELVSSQVCVSKNTPVNRSKCFAPNFYWESTVLPSKLGSKQHDHLTIVIFINIGLWTYKFAQFIALPSKICCFCWKLNHLF